MTDVTKKPVHPVLVKPTPLEGVKKRFGQQTGALESPGKQPLPVEAPEAPSKPKLERPKFAGPGEMMKQETTKRRLRLYYDSLPKTLFPPEKTPPCSTCKTSPCCSSFVVSLRREEYESGLYAPYAVKIEAEALKQLSTFSAHVMKSNPDGGPSYFIEGVMGEPCPFLGSDRKCTIYADRPLTCREYTCVDDPRITEEMRNG